MSRRLQPWWGLCALVAAWSVAVALSGSTLVPGPWKVTLGLVELVRRGVLFKYVVASLFRVTWGYLGAVALGVPLGLTLGWFARVGRAFQPLVQVLRPISPLAWTPISILWFGVGDVSAIFLIFLASFFPLMTVAMGAVLSVPEVHLQVGRNFGLSAWQLVRRVILPAAAPKLFIGLRITLGIAWLVVVAAEMLAVSSGLGFLIIDARNAGNRYDLVVAGMVLIGVIGLVLDVGMRRLQAHLIREAPASEERAESALDSEPLLSPSPEVLSRPQP